MTMLSKGWEREAAMGGMTGCNAEGFVDDYERPSSLSNF
jgi:hypothetical protein